MWNEHYTNRKTGNYIKAQVSSLILPDPFGYKPPKIQYDYIVTEAKLLFDKSNVLKGQQIIWRAGDRVTFDGEGDINETHLGQCGAEFDFK